MPSVGGNNCTAFSSFNRNLGLLNSEKYLREAAFLLHAELRLERLSNCTMIFFFEYLLDFQNSYPTDDL